MKRHLHSWLVLGALCALAGCGDDTGEDEDPISEEDAGPSGESGKGGSGGKGGAGGKAGSGGAAGSKAGAGGGAGTAGKGGAGGSEEAAGSGGSAGAAGAAGAAVAGGSGGSGGAGGAAGSGGSTAPVELPNLSNAAGKLIKDVNALSGVTFAADGKIYASGEINVIDESKAMGETPADKYRTSVVGHKLAVYRFLADGTPDAAFGDKGRVIWESPGGDVGSNALTEAEGGAIVVSANVKYASMRTGVALIKFDNTGKLVTTFGDNGRVDLKFGWTDADVADYPKDAMGMTRYPSDQSWDIRAANGGKQLVVFAHGPAAKGELDDSMPPKQRTDNNRYIVRVNASDGAIDPTFNGGKLVTVHTPAVGATGEQTRFPSDGGRKGLVESDGSIVGSGYTNYNDGKGNHIVLIRLKPDGTFDDAFHKERAGQPVLPGVAVFNPVPEADKGFAECYGVAKTAKGYVTTGYGQAYNGMAAASSLGYLPSKAVDMVATRFTGTAVDPTFAREGFYAAQSELLGENKVSTFEDRGRSAVVALADNRAIMGGRFGQYPAIFVLTDAGKLDARIPGKQAEINGILLYPTITSEKQPATSSFYGLALSPDGKKLVASTNGHEQGAMISVLDVKADGTITPVAIP